MLADAAQPLALWVDLAVDIWTFVFGTIVGSAILWWLWRHRHPGGQPKESVNVVVPREDVDYHFDRLNLHVDYAALDWISDRGDYDDLPERYS